MKYTEEEYRMAAEIWREENPGVIRIPFKTVIKLPTGKIINIGSKISYMCTNF